MKGKTKPTQNRLAVLPFVNMSSDPDNEYFSDGITEELLNALAKVDELKVTSRTSAFALKVSMKTSVILRYS
jgi:TolB-like protein